MLGRATFLASVALAVLPAQVLAGKLPKVAVLDVKPIDERSKPVAEILQEVILTDLSKARRFEVVGRSDIAALIGFEKQKAMLGCTEGSCLAEIGGALGADYLLVGTVGRAGSQIRIDLKLIDPKRNKVTAREGTTVPDDEALIRATHTMVQALVEAVPASAMKGARVGAPVGVAHAPSDGGARSGVLPLALGGGAVVLVVAGAVLARSGMAFNDRDLSSLTSFEADAERKTAITKVRVGGAVAGAGLALGAGAAIFYLTRTTETTIALAPGPVALGASVSGQF